MPGEKCYILAPVPLHFDARGLTLPSGNSDDSEHLRSYCYNLLVVRWYLLMGSTARWVLLCYVQIESHPSVVQVCWRSLAEPGFPISTAQSSAHIPRLKAELLQSPTFIHPCLQRDSAISLASTQPVVHPLCGGLFPPRHALSVCFSHGFWGSVFLTQQRVPKPAGGVLKWGATCSVYSLWHLSLFFIFFFSGVAFLIPKKTEILTEMPSDHFPRHWTPQAIQGRLLLAPVLSGGKTGWRKIR